jgi:hypothetical protein
VAKDLTDYSTLDFIAPTLHLACGQVLMNRQRNIGIVARHDHSHVQLVRLTARRLRLTRLTARELVEDWTVTEYPFEEALPKLLALGRQHGITAGAQRALDKLALDGREPLQTDLFA